MSTNNNRLGKEVQPAWRDEEARSASIKKLSAEKLRRMIAESQRVEDITAMSLCERGVQSIEDLDGLSALRRLDLSKNKLRRLRCLSSLPSLGMLNVSENDFEGSDAVEDLKYLTELRTLNVGDNPALGSISPHVIESLRHLQALIAHGCGITSTEFLRNCGLLNTLILSKNKLSEFPALNPGTFANVVKLSLGHNEFIRVPQLQCCPNLEELRLNGNKITHIPPEFAHNKKIKTLDISNNAIHSWSSIEILVRLPNLTNLSAKNNPLPPPPPERDDFVLREDIASGAISDEKELLYRRHVLGLFQVRVGKEQKLKVRLVVLDTRRVKEKWSHYSEVEGGAEARQRQGGPDAPNRSAGSKPSAKAATEGPQKASAGQDKALNRKRDRPSADAQGRLDRDANAGSEVNSVSKKSKNNDNKSSNATARAAVDASTSRPDARVPEASGGGGILGGDPRPDAGEEAQRSGKKRKLEKQSLLGNSDNHSIGAAEPGNPTSVVPAPKKAAVIDESKLYVVREKKPENSTTKAAPAEKSTKGANVSVDDLLFKPATSFQPQGGWD